MNERRTGIALALVGLALACGDGRSAPARVEAGGTTIEASVAPERSRVGANDLVVVLRDAEGRPIEDAHVEVEVRMPAMGAMPAMGGAADVEAIGDGRYRARYELEMGGTWQVAVRAHRPDGATAAAEGALTVGTPGIRLESVSPGSAPATTAEPQTEAHPGEFRVDPARLRQLGIASEAAERAPFPSAVRAAGRVAWDETTLHDVTVRVGGFVGSVKADALGMRVERGQVLFELYGPELYAAQREYLEALRSRRAAGSVSSRASDLAGAAERRLRLWGLESGDVAAIARSGVPREYLPIRAPITGYVVEKDVVDGAAVEMGQRVYRIASLDRVWIEAEVYEAELAEVAIGTPATVELAYLPGRRFDAKVAWVQPSLDPERRTARVRLVVENPDGALRPDMYATVAIERPSEPRLSVPDSAVLRAGTRSFVFLDLGDGRLRPAPVEIGATRGGRVEILGGLEAGQRVVTRGTFLVSGESRLRAALETW